MSNNKEFLRQMDSQINVWRTQLAQINNKSENLDEAGRKKIEEEYNNLQMQIHEFQDHMGAIENADDNADDNARLELRDEIERLRHKVGKAIGKIASVVNGAAL